MPVSVLLADDAEVFRRTIRALLAKNPEIELVGEAAHMAQTIQLANRLQPQVILMDLGMCYAEPADVKKRLPLTSTRLLVMSTADDVDARLLAASIGASVLIDKAKVHEELVPAILKLGSPSARGTAKRSKARAS